MSEDTTDILVCYRVADCEGPQVQSTVDKCDRCHAAVWHALSSPDVNYVLCYPCAEGMFGKGHVGKSVSNMTQEQFEDLMRVAGSH